MQRSADVIAVASVRNVPHDRLPNYMMEDLLADLVQSVPANHPGYVASDRKFVHKYPQSDGRFTYVMRVTIVQEASA